MAGISGGFNPFAQQTTRQGPGRAGFSVEFKGLKEMTQKLHRQLLRMEQKYLRQACEAFAEPIRADAERRARIISPQVKIGVNIRIRGTTAQVKIGPTKDFFWLFFFEYGWWRRKGRKGQPITWSPKAESRLRGPVATMRPAYDARKEEGLAAMEKILFEAFGEEGTGTQLAG